VGGPRCWGKSSVHGALLNNFVEAFGDILSSSSPQGQLVPAPLGAYRFRFPFRAGQLGGSSNGLNLSSAFDPDGSRAVNDPIFFFFLESADALGQTSISPGPRTAPLARPKGLW